MSALELDQEALDRYQRASELAAITREAWEQAGKPLVVSWPNGIESESPLLKLMREAERDAERFLRAVPKSKRPGRDPVAVVKASVGQSPATRKRAKRGALRAVS